MLGDLTKCEIFLTSQVSPDEIRDLIKREEITTLANARFSKGEIFFQDYIDCLEVVGVRIDDYLLVLENNLISARFL